MIELLKRFLSPEEGGAGSAPQSSEAPSGSAEGASGSGGAEAEFMAGQNPPDLPAEQEAVDSGATEDAQESTDAKVDQQAAPVFDPALIEIGKALGVEDLSRFKSVEAAEAYLTARAEYLSAMPSQEQAPPQADAAQQAPPTGPALQWTEDVDPNIRSNIEALAAYNEQRWKQVDSVFASLANAAKMQQAVAQETEFDSAMDELSSADGAFAGLIGKGRGSALKASSPDQWQVRLSAFNIYNAFRKQFPHEPPMATAKRAILAVAPEKVMDIARNGVKTKVQARASQVQPAPSRRQGVAITGKQAALSEIRESLAVRGLPLSSTVGDDEADPFS